MQFHHQICRIKINTFTAVIKFEPKSFTIVMNSEGNLGQWQKVTLPKAPFDIWLAGENEN